ncbi:MAG: PstS family phosphate ABC transporter substrate-binding protein [Dokdonella sp.]|uniref:PstS family phosphate ABC transporter substrate-binding protein n=1 Tax=Dokdonella sp. TaxID=2291710 RepID=UPI003F7EEA4D
MKRLVRLATFALAACAAPALAADGVAGTLTCAGSDTASSLLTHWAAAFQARHRGVRIQAQASGSASAPIALTEGAADLGLMSRPMDSAEEAAFRARFGYAPTRLVVAHDAIAVFVHPDNPRVAATLAELDAIYSSTLACGARAPIRHWSDLPGDGWPQALLAVGRDSGSGTHELFRELALCGGRYRAEVVAWPGNGAVIATVAGHREAIGYAGFGYVNATVKPLAIAPAAGAPAVAPDERGIASGRYPLARAIHVYLNRRPQHAPAALPRAFLEYILSDDGQEVVRREGFIPLDADEARGQRALIE